MLNLNVNTSLNKQITTPQNKAVLNTTKPTNTEEKTPLSKKLKWGVGLGLTALAAGGIYIATRGKAAPKTKPIDNALVSFKNEKAYNNKGELFTGAIAKESKSGNKLVTLYIDGAVAKREYIPVKHSEIKKIVKTYDTHTHNDARIMFSEIEKHDGTTVYERTANFLERKFPPEIESKVKMKDFDNTDITKIKDGTTDLGDGIVLKKDGSDYSLLQNGELIREKYNLLDLSSISNNNFRIWKEKGNYDRFHISTPKGYTSYSKDGSFCEVTLFDNEGYCLEKNIYKDYDALGNLIQTRQL